MAASEPNLLIDSGLPIFFDAGQALKLGVAMPADRHGQSVRVFARSLSVMQKEAVVVSTAGGTAWRLASDEGPYLNGFDSAPCPLSFLTTGMVSATMNEMLRLAASRGVRIDDLVLVQDNRYTMQGSALKGTMTGGALPVDLEVRCRTSATDDELSALVSDALRASPAHGLLDEVSASLFSLTVNGSPEPVGRARSLPPLAESDPADSFPATAPAGGMDPGLIRRLQAAETVHGVAGGASTSLSDNQSRQLHVRGTCRLLDDGRKEIVQELFAPIGSTFRFVSDEDGRAPDAASYMAAGIAFCFMTQLGRYAHIRKKGLTSYAVIQDMHFSAPGAAGGCVDPVETHVYLQTPEGTDFARDVLDMGEQTCFLHALCRTPLTTRVRTVRSQERAPA